MSGDGMQPENPRPGFKHPMMGARLGLLLRSLTTNGPIALRNAPLITAMVLSAMARLPIATLERYITARRRHSAPELQAPIFIIGHWRSGTTHTHNLMARSPQFGWISPLATGIPGEILTLGTWLRPWLEKMLPEDRMVDHVAVNPDSPQPDEIPLANMQPLSVFHALYFPHSFQYHIDKGVFFEGCSEAEIKRWRTLMVAFLRKIVIQQGKSRLLIKNESYMTRVALLRSIWPEAKFIHVHRNPYEVYVSTVSYFRRLLPTMAFQSVDHVDVESFVLNTYPRVMRRFLRDTAQLSGEQFVEVGFQEITSTPIETLWRIYDQLQLPNWEDDRSGIEEYLASIRNYERNKFTMASDDIERVRSAWGDYSTRWGYGVPEAFNPAAADK